MMIISTTFIMFTSIVILLMTMCSMISKKSILDREKMSPFECGFDPNSSPRTPFSIQFFLIATLFLIFDVEIVIIVPMIVTFNTVSLNSWMIVTSIFIIILLVGLYHEWYNNMLEWPL